MKVVSFLSIVFGYSAAAVLGVMMLLTVCDVALRYFLSAPIIGGTELTELMMVVIVFPTLGWCVVTRRHLKVEILTSAFPRMVRVILEILTSVATLIVFSIISWQTAIEASLVEERSSLLHIPHAPFYWIITLGLSLFCLSILAVTIEKIIEVVRR